MPQLSVIIPCKDEERNIRQCIAAVREIADELIIADSGSTDRTLDYVEQSGVDRIIQREYVNSANFKNWAIPQAQHPWVLIVDADERITRELAVEIKELMSREPEADGYAFRRAAYVLGRQIRHCGWNNDWITRLFRRDVCHYEHRRVHAQLVVPTGKTARLNGTMLHFTVRDLGHLANRLNRYSTWSAEDLVESGADTSFLQLALKAPFRFFSTYLLQGGIWDGTAGFIISASLAHCSFLKAAKVWMLRHGGDFPDLKLPELKLPELELPELDEPRILPMRLDTKPALRRAA